MTESKAQLTSPLVVCLGAPSDHASGDKVLADSVIRICSENMPRPGHLTHSILSPKVTIDLGSCIRACNVILDRVALGARGGIHAEDASKASEERVGRPSS